MHLTVLIRKSVYSIVRVSGLFRVALSLPLLFLSTCTSIPSSSSVNSLNSSPKASLNPAAGPVAAQTRLIQSFPQLIVSMQTLLPMPVAPLNQIEI